MPVSGSPKKIIATEMHKFKEGELHSGSAKGPKVTSRKQAVAIAMSESRQGNRGPSKKTDMKGYYAK